MVKLLLLQFVPALVLAAVSSSTDDGPCRMLNNGMKCTAAGYFELVQCDKSSCFCVQANNGEIAYDTRTSNGQTAPKCSVCYTRLQQLYANGQPHADSYVPLCDNKKGEFEALQCTADRKTCFCVDTKTGKELAGTKQQVEPNMVMVCGDAPSGGNGGSFPTIQTAASNMVPVANAVCKLGKDSGRRCNGFQPTVQYYFDSETFMCLAFQYLGCGGNGNRYASSGACYSNCMLMDMSGCSGMLPSPKKPNGEPYLCGNVPMFPPPPAPGSNLRPPPPPPSPDAQCPQGHKCVMGAFFGTCCNSTVEELYTRESGATCYNKKQALKVDEYAVLLGKSCSDNFCPQNTKCEQGEVFARCC